MTAPAVMRRWSDPAVDQAVDVVGPIVRGHLARLRSVAPLGAALLTVVVAHVVLTPHLVVRGAAPDGLLVGVTAMAVARGPRAGAAFGFAAGLCADLFLTTPLGTSALAFTLVGHVLGRPGPGPSGAAAALCSPASTCFACRTGRLHRSPDDDRPVIATSRPPRVRRRVAIRRAVVRRSAVLVVLGVAGGRLATAVAATAFGGVPFPGPPGLIRIAAVAAVSAPLGPPVVAAARRLPSAAVRGGRR